MRLLFWGLAILLLLAGCAPVDKAPAMPSPPIAFETALTTPFVPSPLPPALQITASTAPCLPAPVNVPTLPAVIPRTNELDETTGFHMTGEVQYIDLPSYRLVVSGLVDHPLSLKYDELRCMPRVTAVTRIECSTFIDSASFTGVPLAAILNLADIQIGAERIELVGADGYTARVPLEEALKAENYLAYEWQGKPLPILHGFPIRALFPSQAGAFSVKWLVEIRVQ